MTPDPELVEHFRQALAAKPKGTRGGYAQGYTVALVREAAEDHSQSCGGCSTCEHFRRLLAFMLAYELNEAPPEVLRMIHRMDETR